MRPIPILNMMNQKGKSPYMDANSICGSGINLLVFLNDDI